MSKKSGQKLVVANWKMNPSSLKEAQKTFSQFKRQRPKNKGVTAVFCPPFQYIEPLKKSYSGNKIFFGAQDVFWEKEGAYTGEISTSMIKDAGARFVIVGHSERRTLGETNEDVSQKVLTSLKAGLHVILCVGEAKRDSDGSYLKELSEQIKESLQEVPKNITSKLIIAYEPLWAIGEGNKAMDSKEMHFISLFIQKQLVKIFGRTIAKRTPILYGGSVDSENAGEFIQECDIDGLLVGRASLNPYEFAKIIDNVSSSIK
jgi:triosephosphate isomerase